MQKALVAVKVMLVMDIDYSATSEIDEVISEMDYDFVSQSDGVTIVYTEIRDHAIKSIKTL